MENKQKRVRPLRVFTHLLQIGHNYELFKLPFDWHIYKSVHAPKWNIGCRPVPNNMIEVDKYENGKYDLAILFLNTQGMMPGFPLGELYRELNEKITDIPKIVINNSTPYYPNTDTNLIINKMKKLIGKNMMITTSLASAKKWGFGKCIWHGMEVNEWFRNTKWRKVTSCIHPAGIPEYYGFDNLDIVKKGLGNSFEQIAVDKKAYSFFELRYFMSKYLIYYNPTIHSPMPRSRTEAMLSGCCIVTTGYDDEREFIKHGENGFIVNDANEALEIIRVLMSDLKETRRIALNGMRTARNIFNKERFQNDWLKAIKKTGVNPYYK